MDFTSLLFISTLLYTLAYVKSSSVSKQTPKVCREIPNCEACPELKPFGILCVKCKRGYLTLQRGLGQDIECVISCPEGYHTHKLQCLEDGCKDLYCTKCQSGWVKAYQMKKNCVKRCPHGFYEGHDSMLREQVCKKCRSDCKTCSDSMNCKICSHGYSLVKRAFSRCVARCPKGYLTIETGKGQVCQNDIKGCVNKRCSKCRKGWFHLKDWINSQCIKNCPAGYFEVKRGNQLRCAKCIYNCEKCSTSVTCDRCIPGFSLFFGRSRSYCVKRCPKKYTSEYLKTKRMKICRAI